MKSQILAFSKQVQSDLIQFAQDIVRIKSYTCNEEELANFVIAKMNELGYDEVFQDKLGNVIGVVGTGEKEIFFDAHLDTVEVQDEEDWTYGPFSGEIVDGKLYGRGSTDMKGAVAATVYAGHAIKQLGLAEGKKVYISTSIMEEDYDGEAVSYLFKENDIKPDYVVICEPSSLQLALGHNGRALVQVDMDGVSAHGSAPEKGVNAIYKMNQIISRVENLGLEMMKADTSGSLALTKIESEAVSINAIPPKCSIYLDRRLDIGEDWDHLTKEMNMLLEGTGASWSIYDEAGESWKGEKLVLHSFLPAWEIEKEHHLAQSCLAAYEDLNEKEPIMIKWDFCTNGVAPARLGIPTIGFGPGTAKLAHMTDEYCLVDEIVSAFEFYTNLVKHI